MDAVVQQRIHEELLLEVAGADRNAARGLHPFRNLQPLEKPVPVITGGHRLAGIRAKEDILVEVQFGGIVGIDLVDALGAEALQLVERDGDFLVTCLVVELGNLVVEIVLRLEPDRPGLELHVHVLGDKDRGRRELLLHKEGRRDDAVVLLGEVGQDRLQPVHGGRPPAWLREVGIDDDRERAAIRQLHTLMHGPRVGQQLLENPVDATGVAPALRGLLTLDGIKLFENLDRDGQVVLLELVDRLGIVKEDVRVQNEGLYFRRNLEPRIWG